MKETAVRISLAICILICLATTALAQQSSFVGTWRGSYTMGGMMVSTETIFMADGTFSAMQTSSAGYASRITGTYSFPTQGIIHYVNQDWSPRELHIPPTEDDQYEFLSPTTFRSKPLLPGIPWMTSEKVQ
jgi:hypothetical protein